MSEELTGKTVSFTPNPLNPPTLTADERTRLAAMTDEDIDMSEIPSQDGTEGWTRPGWLGGPAGELRLAALRKNLLLLDDRVVEFFNPSGDEAPAKMNAVLLEYVEMHRKSA
jgi:uncharacterized protein (DUF4415 family)